MQQAFTAQANRQAHQDRKRIRWGWARVTLESCVHNLSSLPVRDRKDEAVPG